MPLFPIAARFHKAMMTALNILRVLFLNISYYNSFCLFGIVVAGCHCCCRTLMVVIDIYDGFIITLSVGLVGSLPESLINWALIVVKLYGSVMAIFRVQGFAFSYS